MVAAAGVMALGAPAVLGAQVPPAPLAQPASNVAAEVAAFYQRFPNTRIWFKAGADSPAVARLIAILDRSPFDGLANGPQLARAVEVAQTQARTGDPVALAAADRALSMAWVEYVQLLKKPTPGMLYEVPYLLPKNGRTDQILLTTAAAPSLPAYLEEASNPNVIYTSLRDTAYAAARASGNLAPDPRLLANLQRVRSIPSSGKFMVVDSGTQVLTMYENGKPYDSMKIVVGKSEYATPMIASIMYYIVYNPYWNAPDHLVRRIAQNYLSQGDSYLKSRGYQVMKDWTAASEVVPSSEVDWKAVASGKIQVRVRQKPSGDNSMGDLKFPFPNGQDIFLHDTPTKEYFARSTRTLSNGCVRLEDARRLGRWLLGTEPVSPGNDAEIQVQLPRGVPVYLTYVTAEVKDGQIAYRADPYGWDPAGSASKAAGR